MFNREGVYYSEDTVTRKQHSLRTKDEAEALTLLHSKNEELSTGSPSLTSKSPGRT